MKKIVCLIMMLFTFTGCSTQTSNSSVGITPKNDALFSEGLEIPTGKVKIRIKRSNDMQNILLKANIKINGIEVAALYRNDEFVGIYDSGVIKVSVDTWSEPGTYTFNLPAESGTEYILEVMPNQASNGAFPPFYITPKAHVSK